VRVLIAPDKFKGTLTAWDAALSMARGWRRTRPDDQLTLLPISDGGDGFGSVLARHAGAKRVRNVIVDASGRRAVAAWWWNTHQQTAILESARVIGLAMLPPRQFHPFQLDTRGLGMLLRAVARRGVQRCIVGIGGSATNDGGFGLARELGWRFVDQAGKEIRAWTDLSALARVEVPRRRTWPKQVIVAVDVRNRLLGAQGCTRMYGPQKGLRREDFETAEAALRRLAVVLRRTIGRDHSRAGGAGAAGGLGFGLGAFLGAKLVPGFDLVAHEIKLAPALRRADLVVTGEGRLDASTLMGKGTGELAKLCAARKVPCIGLAGEITDRRKLQKLFTQISAMTDYTSTERACADSKQWLEITAAAAAKQTLTRLR
jgi:glycerate kinase